MGSRRNFELSTSKKKKRLNDLAFDAHDNAVAKTENDVALRLDNVQVRIFPHRFFD